MSQLRKIFIILLVLIPALWLLASIRNAFQEQTTQAEMPPTPTSLSFEDADYAVTIPDKALIKNYLTVSLETESGTACKLTFIPPSGTVREMETTAKADGLCEWRWKIEETDGKGHGRLIFTIDGVSDTHFIDIRESF